MAINSLYDSGVIANGLKTTTTNSVHSYNILYLYKSILFLIDVLQNFVCFAHESLIQIMYYISIGKRQYLCDL